MAAEAKKVWVEATQLDSQGQVVGGATLSFTILASHLVTLTYKTTEPSSGILVALDLEKQNLSLEWEPVGSLSVLGEENLIGSGTYRASCHLYAGTPNESGQWYGETTFTLMPYEDLDS